MPTTYTWSKVGERKIINYEAPKKRRVNAVGAYSGDDFRYHVESGKLTAEVFVAFLFTTGCLELGGSAETDPPS